MIDKPVRSDLQPAEDGSPANEIAVGSPVRAHAPVARTLVVATVVLTAWTGLLVALVVASAIGVVPALVLFVLALIVLMVEVGRSRAAGRNRFGTPPAGVIAPDILSDLLEIERASVAEERRVLLARELSRLAAQALRPDPAVRATWPTPEQFASLRHQIALLRASATDPRTRDLPVGSPVGHITDSDLTGAIQLLSDYVGHLSRMQLLDVDNREQTRIAVRDQSRLRAMQDKIVGQLREPAFAPPVD